MRRRIRLTGRRQLPRSAIEAKIFEEGGRPLLSMVMKDQTAFEKFPTSSRLKLRLFENKVSETLEFGTIAAPRITRELKSSIFAAPSCQLRVVGTGGEREGLILGSTDTWTMQVNPDDRGGTASEGLLMFQPHDIAPLSWSLDIREDDYPIVYVDRSIPQSGIWVRNDPVFVSCVLPMIVREVFEDILMSANEPPEHEWARNWLEWADTIMAGKAPPWNDTSDAKRQWIRHLLEGFCQRHSTLDTLLRSLRQEDAAQ